MCVKNKIIDGIKESVLKQDKYSHIDVSSMRGMDADILREIFIEHDEEFKRMAREED